MIKWHACDRPTQANGLTYNMPENQRFCVCNIMDCGYQRTLKMQP